MHGKKKNKKKQEIARIKTKKKQEMKNTYYVCILLLLQTRQSKECYKSLFFSFSDVQHSNAFIYFGETNIIR